MCWLYQKREDFIFKQQSEDWICHKVASCFGSISLVLFNASEKECLKRNFLFPLLWLFILFSLNDVLLCDFPHKLRLRSSFRLGYNQDLNHHFQCQNRYMSSNPKSEYTESMRTSYRTSFAEMMCIPDIILFFVVVKFRPKTFQKSENHTSSWSNALSYSFVFLSCKQRIIVCMPLQNIFWPGHLIAIVNRYIHCLNREC